jgi:hypothetical protein
LTINATTTFKARILNGGVWSALNEATFSVGTTVAPVRITELMYNPPGGTAHELHRIAKYRDAAGGSGRLVF